MRNTDFNELFYSFVNYGDKKNDPHEPKVEFDFGSEKHREYLCWADDFTYAHFKINDGAMTVGGTRIGDKLYYAVSLCSPKDNFSKDVGRAHVKRHLRYAEYSKKRGVMKLANGVDNVPPAIVLREAAKQYFAKMRHRPAWTVGGVVEFRTERRMVRKGANVL